MGCVNSNKKAPKKSKTNFRVELVDKGVPSKHV
jgi:hypothetical protein